MTRDDRHLESTKRYETMAATMAVANAPFATTGTRTAPPQMAWNPLTRPRAPHDFRPVTGASPRLGLVRGSNPQLWRNVSDETMNVAAHTAATSLLFQAPTFQAPEFRSTPAPGDDDTASVRKRRTRTTRATRVDDRSEDAEAASPVDSDEAETPRKRTRRVSKKRDSEAAQASAETGADTASESEADASDEESPAEETSTRRRRVRTRARSVSVDSDGDDATETAGDVGDGEDEGSSRRRRRRRTRSNDEGGDLSDQVTALKGSTRLEAKKQRRREGRKEGRRRHSITESEFLARRESVTRKMVIRHRDGLDQIAILEDDLLVEHYVARRTQSSMVGNIYMGRVQNVLPSMEAAFVDIGRGRNAVLYAGEVNWDAVGLEGRPRRIESALKGGDSVLVQVTKDPIGHKGARLTSQITLAGRYLVLIPGGSMMGISRKLPDRERSRLKKILRDVVPADAGVIVRTAAEGASEEQIREDVARLTKQWADIERKKTTSKSAPVLLRGEPELAVRVVRDIFNEDFTSLVIEGRDTYHTVKEYVDELSPELSDRVQQWVDREDLFAAHRIDEQLAKGMDRKVWLPSGGTLVIDRTEAMTVVDVNTGKFIGAGGTLEETVTRNNLEAAEEIVRQLRLRDIGGIVIIDFVDMVLESNRDLVLRRLVECLGRDRTRHQVTEITSLGLVQMTRKRVGEGLVEAFSTTCEACEGRGFIVHSHPVENGSGDTPPSSRKAKKSAEAPARRIDDGPEREKAREALSAIAAAAREAHKDDDSINEAGEPPIEAPVDADLSVKKPTRSRRRAVSISSATPDAAPPVEGDTAQVSGGTAEVAEVPASSAVTEAGAQSAAEMTTGEAKDSAPASSQDAGNGAETADAVEDPASSAEETLRPAPAQKTAPVQKTPSRPRRRRVVSSASAEPAPVVLDLPARVDAPAAPPADVPAIVLPERSQVAAPATKVRRRRRVATTGVVSTGEDS